MNLYYINLCEHRNNEYYNHLTAVLCDFSLVFNTEWNYTKSMVIQTYALLILLNIK